MTDIVQSEVLADLRKRTKDALEADVTLQEVNEIPSIGTIKVEVPHWYRVDNVVAVVADLRNSTGFNTVGTRRRSRGSTRPTWASSSASWTPSTLRSSISRAMD